MGFIPEDIIAQVVERCDIVEVISDATPLKKAGRNFKGLCPFHHEKTPSFVVNPDKQIFHCFGCGEGGNVISFLMKHEHFEFPEAVRILANRVGVNIPETSSPASKKKKDLNQALYHIHDLAKNYFHNELVSSRHPKAQEAREYLKSRQVSLDIVNQFQMGYAPDEWEGLLNYLKTQDISLSLIEQSGLIVVRENKSGYYDRFRNRIIFPIFDIRSRCVAFGARALEETGAKYINSPESPIYVKGNHLYGLSASKQNISSTDQVIVVEGYMDFIMPFQSGVGNMVASLGTALTTEQIRLVRRYTKNIVMLFDSDPAGESAIIRSLDILLDEEMNVSVAVLDEGKDPDSFIREYGREEFDKRIKDALPLFDYKLEILKKNCNKSSIEGRAKICSEMFPTMAKMNNAIVRSEYLRQLSGDLNVSEEALIVELNKFLTGKTRNKRPADKVNPTISKAIEAKIHSAEYNILKVLLENKQFIKQTREMIDLADLQDQKVRQIINKLYNLQEQKQDLSPASLMNLFDDKVILQIISSLTAKDQYSADNVEQIHRDCINRIRQDRVKEKRQALVDEIKDAERRGDQEKLDQLKCAFNDLVKK